MSESIDAEAWEGIVAGRAVVVDLQTVRWDLSVTPDPDWVTAFRNAPTTKSGSMEYVLTGSEPAVHGREIEWRVGPRDQLDANLRVREKVEVANGKYREILKRRAEEEKRAQENERARKAAIEEAQRKLDEANGVGD